MIHHSDGSVTLSSDEVATLVKGIERNLYLRVDNLRRTTAIPVQHSNEVAMKLVDPVMYRMLDQLSKYTLD